MTDDYPQVTKLSYVDFATLDCTVTRETPLEGNSGSSSLRVQVRAGLIWLGDEMRGHDSSQDFTIHLTGASEHSVLAEALRDAADVLDPQPRTHGAAVEPS